MTTYDNGTTVIECQHGDEECLGNTIEACVVKNNDNRDQLISFIYCMGLMVENSTMVEAGEKVISMLILS